MIYESKTWILYCKQVADSLVLFINITIDFFLKIKWNDIITNDEVLQLTTNGQDR